VALTAVELLVLLLLLTVLLLTVATMTVAVHTPSRYPDQILYRAAITLTRFHL
jgi:hypothetical protein